MTVKLSEIERTAERAVLALAGQALAEQIARLPALTAALRDVLALHVPTAEPSKPCGECGDFYPCPTVRTITAHVDPT